MKHLLHFPLLVLPLAAQLRITEVMSSSDHSTGSANGDWFEITNTGASAVNLGGYSFDDSSPTPKAPGQIFPSHALAPDDSVIVLRESDASSFRSLWKLPASFKIFTEADVPNFPGFGSEGDTVFLFDDRFRIVDQFTFGPATSGVSFARFSNGNPVPGDISIDGFFGAYQSDDSSEDVGSPGIVADPPAPLPPVFIAPFSTHWITGRNLSDSEFRINAPDPNAGDVVTLSAVSKPAWLTFADLGNGRARLSGTPTAAEVGIHEVVVRAADSSGVTDSVTQSYQITIAPATSPIILNEYNAVNSDDFLGGGAPGDPGAPADATLGRIAGNGGAWIEFVVAGDGVSQTVDLRNWTVRIEGDDKLRNIKLSNHIALSVIPAGTILTFTADQTVGDTALPRFSDFIGNGYSWSNIWMSDPILIDQAASDLPLGKVIGNNDTKITLLDGADRIVYGPIGESILGKDNNANGLPDEILAVSDSEVLKLEANPTSSVSPLSVDYDDGDTSTFGKPNIWNNNLSTQSFAPFKTDHTSPVFGAIPSRMSVDGVYSANVSISNPGGKPLTVTAQALPSFLTLASTADLIGISNNRPLTSADVGMYEITVQADNGGASNNSAWLIYQLEIRSSTTPFQGYLASVGLAGSDAESDSDRDGFSNLDEYLFGGDPSDATVSPKTSFVLGADDLTFAGNVRISDPAYEIVAEWSTDLQTWETGGLTIEDLPSDLGAGFVNRTVTLTGKPERVFFRFSTSTGR